MWHDWIPPYFLYNTIFWEKSHFNLIYLDTNSNTDGDTLWDGEEVNIGLDPNDQYTYDVIDSEYTFKQKITSEQITNFKQNEYKVSVEVCAAGDVASYFDVRDSVYDEVLNGNNAILGKPVELAYDRKVDTVKITFEPNELYVDMSKGIYSDDEGLTGVKRYQIFRFDEKHNTLYPVLTDFNTETNEVFALQLKLLTVLQLLIRHV